MFAFESGRAGIQAIAFNGSHEIESRECKLFGANLADAAMSTIGLGYILVSCICA